MATRKNIAGQSQTFARQAQNQFNELKRSLQSAQMSLANLHSALHVPVIKRPRGRIPATTSGPSDSFMSVLNGFGGLLSGGLQDFADNQIAADNSTNLRNFDRSASQLAGNLFDTIVRGQRVR